MGRDWLAKLKLNWNKLFPAGASLNAVRETHNSSEEVEDLVAKYPDVFTEKLGCLRDFKVNIPIPSDAKPRFFKAGTICYDGSSRC